MAEARWYQTTICLLIALALALLAGIPFMPQAAANPGQPRPGHFLLEAF